MLINQLGTWCQKAPSVVVASSAAPAGEMVDAATGLGGGVAPDGRAALDPADVMAFMLRARSPARAVAEEEFCR